MSAHRALVPDPVQQATLALLDDLFGEAAPPGLAVRLWDGTMWQPAGRPRATPQPRCTLVLQHPRALRRMFTAPSDLALGEAYVYNDFDVEGDMAAIFELADGLFAGGWSLPWRLRLAALLKQLPADGGSRADRRGLHLVGTPHSQPRDRQAVTYHYDVSNDFYRLWLDRRMVYSCAYFLTSEDNLDTAQEQKLDYICRKLRLQPGERLLDLGSGWGGLIIHAAAHYGVEAVGITLSRPQAELANRRIRQAGIEDRCRAEVLDYRGLEGWDEFDKLVSVGMFEHVGEGMLPEYFRRAWRLLRPGGVFLNHGIAESLHKPDRGASFVDKYVFPDGELVPISTALRAAEGAGFEVRDLESLREHYALTLQHWVRRLEAHADEARQMAGEVTYRIWRLYMSGSAHRFRTGWLNLYQALLVKPGQGRSGMPLTRADWYGAKSEVRSQK
jgi:cyclopropane-fatty-acyl-phospholipid synthase